MACDKPESASSGNVFMDYGPAIAQAQVSEEPGGKLDLKRCIINWTESRISRARPLSVDGDVAGSVLLEMGSSGFSHYDYVRIEGMLLSNSDGSATNVSQLPLGKLLQKLYKHLPSDFVGSARSETDDGECYFLTVNTPHSSKTVAFYGVPNSTSSGLLVQEMLAVSRGSR